MTKLIPYILILLIAAGVFGYYTYNKPHKETSGVKADFVVTPLALLQAYETDEIVADKTYLDKIIEVGGIVKAINQVDKGGSLSLETGSEMSAIICEFESGEVISKISVGDSVTIKGFCTGKLMDIVLVRCSL